ncbi:Scr1 family TA system antitoxin-like transcriptional regulator [Streptomyces sp. NPDC050485]|uniref:helix-turn-helix domain-containing protein n=1 Tax=Streptomyces sp. NPDC050485 TaxID=3365617 RepID=UPI0037A42ACE
MQPRKNTSAMRMVGAQLACFRRAAGHTQRTLAELVCAEPETIASIEQGRRVLKPELARELDALLDTKGALTVAVENMPEVDRYPLWAEKYMDEERVAIALSFYANQVLPGLLQNEEYARAVFQSRVPAYGEDEITFQVGARLDRQAILHRKVPPSLSFVLSEAIIRDRLGGHAVHRGMLRHLRECAELPGLALQIMPLGRKSHAALAGPFILLETPQHQHLAYTETQRGSQFVADPDEVSILARKYAMLRTQALNTEASMGLLDRLLGER